MAPFTTHTSQRSLPLILSAIHDSRAPSHLFVQSHFPGEWQDQVRLAPEPAVNHYRITTWTPGASRPSALSPLL